MPLPPELAALVPNFATALITATLVQRRDGDMTALEAVVAAMNEPLLTPEQRADLAGAVWGHVLTITCEAIGQIALYHETTPEVLWAAWVTNIQTGSAPGL